MYSTNNEGKSVFAEMFIRTLKNKIYKYITSISKNVYINKLDDIVDEYNTPFFDKHNNYKHIEAEISEKSKHIVSIF